MTSQLLDLNGHWQLAQAGSADVIPATVPGCVHTDLLAAGLIPDPWYRDNEKAVLWVWERDWVYERAFSADAALLACPRCVLVCEGLDTLASVQINGLPVLEADNMFHAWEADVRHALREGDNRIRVTFRSPRALMRDGDARRRLPGWNFYHEDHRGRSYVRKMACAFGWDWGLVAPTAGIWRPIRIHAFHGRVSDLRVRQAHLAGSVELAVDGAIDGAGDAVRVRLERAGPAAVEAVARVQDGRFSCIIAVARPELWWPNGMGSQPLYRLTATLERGAAGLDARTLRIGLRTVELVREPDEFGESFRFRVNGRDLFAKGANWIPCDVFPSRVGEATLRRLLKASADSHFNMLRVWGGGIYEDERFYDLCDESGILVWQDFMFACGTYPTFDDAFNAGVRREAAAAVRRLCHRACLALWCGNNEIEQAFVDWKSDTWSDRQMPAADYIRMWDVLLPEVVAAEDGVTPYWPSSSHTPGANRVDFNDPTCGDAHAWSVWFGGQPFEAQRDWCYRFMSEFGFQSFPEPRTIAAFTGPEDRFLNSWIMDTHQRSGPGNGTILRYLLDWFRPPGGFEDLLWMSQLTQALCVQYAAEHARRIQGRMDGLLYWQLNDLWPAPTWSSIDVFGRWKALQFLARRFFAPVLVSMVESVADSTVGLHVSNHLPDAFAGTLCWEITDCRGARLRAGSLQADVASQSNLKAIVLDCADLRAGSPAMPRERNFCPHPPLEADRDLLVWAWIEAGGREVSRNLAFFAKPKHLRLERPAVTVELIPAGEGRITLRLQADRPAPWTQLELTGVEGDFSDNFIHLHPRRPSEVMLTASGPVKRDNIRVTPLVLRAGAADPVQGT